jgi:hypothetical protein
MSAGAQRLFLYLLTCPHSNLIGLYILKNGYIMEDLDLSPQALKSLLKEVTDSGMVKRCDSNNIIFIPNYLKFNALTNPNQVTAAKGIVESMPKSFIISDFMSSLEGLNEGRNQSLHEGLVSVLVLESVLESELELDKPIEEKKSDNFIEGFPIEFQESNEFNLTWLEWLTYKKEKRNSMTPTTAKKQIRELSSMTIQGAIETIDHSIKNGYTGLYSPKGKQGASKDNPAYREFMEEDDAR